MVWAKSLEWQSLQKGFRFLRVACIYCTVHRLECEMFFYMRLYPKYLHSYGNCHCEQTIIIRKQSLWDVGG